MKAAYLLPLLALPLAAAAADRAFPYDIETHRLDNGLSVSFVEYPSPGVVAYYTLVRVGSRHEVEAGHSGFAHFFEHMMFRGTPDVPQSRYEQDLMERGVDGNAFTTDDFTCYVIDAPSTALERIIELEADRFQNLAYDETVFQTESRAVLGEYNKSASDPLFRGFQLLRSSAFEKHTYRHTTMGFLEDVEAMPGYYQYSLGFFRRFYTPDNTAVFVVGDFDREKTLAKIRESYGGWKGARAEVEIRTEPPLEGPREARLAWERPTPTYVLAAWRTPRFDLESRDTAALHLVSELAFGRASPLYRKLVVEDASLIDLGPLGGWPRRDPYLLMARATLKEGTAPADVIDALSAELTRLAESGPDPARLEALRSRTRYQVLMDLDTPGAVAVRLALFAAVAGDPAAIESWLARLGEVSVEDVQRVAKQFLNEKHRVTVTIAHDPEGAAKTKMLHEARDRLRKMAQDEAPEPAAGKEVAP